MLLLMPASGGEPEVLLQFPPGGGGPGQIAWLPDGTALSGAGRRSGICCGGMSSSETTPASRSTAAEPITSLPRVVDPATITDNATFQEPHQYATGVKHVFVNGTHVVRNGEHTGAKPGRVVRGPGWEGW